MFIISVGYLYFTAPPNPETKDKLAYSLKLFTVEQYGLIMLTVGVACFIGAYIKARWALALMVFGTTFWGFGFVWSMLFYNAPWQTISVVLLYWTMTAVLLRVATWNTAV